MGLFCFARRAFVTNRYVGINCWEARYCSPTFHGGLSTLPATNVRKYSQDGAAAAGRFVCCHLPNRTLLKVQGQDTSSFLQGIITNDMRQLLEEQSLTAMYSHMLNVQGRILYDILLYRLQGADGGQGVLLECDFTVKDSILKLLKMYKIRRKVSIDDCPDYSVWAVLPQQEILSQEVGQPMISFPEKAIVWEADPRTTKMGWRLVTNKETEPSDIIATCQKAETDEYHRHRFTIGIPEGVKDLPPGVALPLESNLVYMQGISFSKGCYIGQELTARTHHTGVIRKRLMPVRFSSPFHNLEDGAALQTQSGKPAGKHRSGVGNHGLGLIRLAHAKEVFTVKSSDDTTLTLEVSVPDWWPKDWNSN